MFKQIAKCSSRGLTPSCFKLYLGVIHQNALGSDRPRKSSKKGEFFALSGIVHCLGAGIDPASPFLKCTKFLEAFRAQGFQLVIEDVPCHG